MYVCTNATHKCVETASAIPDNHEVMEGDLQKTFGANLRIVRRSKGLTQSEFADYVGLHRTYMGGVERGERNLTLKSVERIAETLGIDALRLLQADIAL